jgi:large subunit ribosomal protein L6
MSRIGNRVLTIPEGVTVENIDGMITVKGPKGSLSHKLADNVTMKQEDGKLTLECKDALAGAMHGTMNAVINNMITGVTKGYEKSLEIIGVGYRFNVQGNKLGISAGFSHPVNVEIPTGLTVTAGQNNDITIHGIDKVLVGEFAADVRKIRQPEPYKGKGIRYVGEHVRHKEGKKAAK